MDLHRPAQGRPILVIEDHEDTRHMVEQYLTFEGISVVGAENGMVGLEALQEHRPSLILLDLTMPVMDGWRFRAEQQRLSDGQLAEVPVVVLSALPEAESHAAKLRAVDTIPKPIDFDRMLAIVRRYYVEE